MPGGLSIQDITQMLFPPYSRWLQEFSSPSGDHCKAAESFLTKVLPFLAKVIIQDGIYWIHKHPQNSASQILLRLNIGGIWYSNWARSCRQIIVQNVKQINKEGHDNENIASTIDKIQMQLSDSNNLLRRIYSSVIVPAAENTHSNITNAQTDTVPPTPLTDQQTTTSPHPPDTRTQPVIDSFNVDSNIHSYRQGSTISNNPHHNPTSTGTEEELRELQTISAVSLQDALRHSEEPLQIQVLTPNRYGSVQNLLHLRLNHRHHHIGESSAFSRGDSRGMRWSQLKYIYNRLECVKKERTVDDIMGAQILDQERGEKSMNEYVKWLRERNEHRHSRRKRPRVTS